MSPLKTPLKTHPLFLSTQKSSVFLGLPGSSNTLWVWGSVCLYLNNYLDLIPVLVSHPHPSSGEDEKKRDYFILPSWEHNVRFILWTDFNCRLLWTKGAILFSRALEFLHLISLKPYTCKKLKDILFPSNGILQPCFWKEDGALMPKAFFVINQHLSASRVVLVEFFLWENWENYHLNDSLCCENQLTLILLPYFQVFV